MKIPPNWNAIVDQHAERVFRIAYRILGSVHDAEDVSQIVFTEAIRVHQKGPVESWTGLFVRLSTLRAIDALRTRNQKQTQPILDQDRLTKTGQHEEAVGAELADWIRDAVGQLPDQQSEVFSLAHFEQLDRNEIASALGITPEAVSTSLYKAKQQLLSQLAVLNGGIRS